MRRLKREEQKTDVWSVKKKIHQPENKISLLFLKFGLKKMLQKPYNLKNQFLSTFWTWYTCKKNIYTEGIAVLKRNLKFKNKQKKKHKNIYGDEKRKESIYILCLSICASVCLYPINVKTGPNSLW